MTATARFDPARGVLGRHTGHALQGVDVRSVRCLPCRVLLLLDANREVVDNVALTARQADAPPPGLPRILPACARCARRVRHADVDGYPEPDPHLNPRTHQLCGPPRAQLPAGGWRELVARVGAPAPADDLALGLSAQHDGPGVASQAVDTSTTRDRRAADAASSSVRRPQHAKRGT